MEWFEEMTLSKDFKTFYMVKEVKKDTIICFSLSDGELIEIPKNNDYTMTSGRPIR